MISEEDARFLVSKQRHRLEEDRARLDSLTGFRADYERLKSQLTFLPTKLRHPMLVPVSKVAYMPGELIHTNEVLALIGDNYFVQCTAPQASGIVDKRISKLSCDIEQLNKEMQLLEDHVTQTLAVLEDQSKFEEICEQLPPDGDTGGSPYTSRKSTVSLEERQKMLDRQRRLAELDRVSHQAVTKDRQSSVNAISESTEPSPGSEGENRPVGVSSRQEADLLARLDELMRREEELDELDRISSSDDSGRSTDEGEEDISERREESSSVRRKSVTFSSIVQTSEDARGEAQTSSSVPTIYFSHSSSRQESCSPSAVERAGGSPDGSITTPADVLKLVQRGPVSILKSSPAHDDLDNNIPSIPSETEPPKATEGQKCFKAPTAFTEVVVERNVEPASSEPQPPGASSVKKPSLFKSRGNRA